jgi:hypothetical protein
MPAFVEASSGAGTVSVRASLSYSRLPAKYGFMEGYIELAIQQEDDAGHWTDVASTPSRDTDNKGSAGPQALATYANVAPFTSVRLELRSTNTPGGADFTVTDAELRTAECIPDASTPGQCL